MDDDLCTLWLERYLHPQGFICPRCGDAKRRLFRAQEHFPAYRCRACKGDYTLLTGTVFEKTRTGGIKAGKGVTSVIGVLLGCSAI